MKKIFKVINTFFLSKNYNYIFSKVYKKRVLSINKFSCQLLFIIAFLLVNRFYSQNNTKSVIRFGLGFGANVSGNSHGTIYDVNGFFSDGNNILGIGPCFHAKSSKITGGKITYNYILINKEKYTKNGYLSSKSNRFQLYFYTHFQFLKDCNLGNNSIKMEQQLSSNLRDKNNSNYNEIKLSTFDLSSGFGFKIKICKMISFSNQIGFSAYYHSKFNKAMYNGRFGPSLALSSFLNVIF